MAPKMAPGKRYGTLGIESTRPERLAEHMKCGRYFLFQRKVIV
jgi:hypothetical protein